MVPDGTEVLLLNAISSVFWTLALAVIPGAGVSLALARRLRLGIAEWFALSVACSIALATAVQLIGGTLGLGLTQGAWVFLIAAFVLTVVGVWDAAGRDPIPLEAWGLAIVAFAVLVGFIEGSWMDVAADSHYHLAAARSLVFGDALLVTDPLYGTAHTELDPTSGVLHMIMAVWATIRDLDVFFFWPGLVALGTALKLTGVWALVRRVASSPRIAALAVVLVFFINDFADARSGAYPSTLAVGLALLATALLIDSMERFHPAHAVALAILGAAVGGLHVGVAQLLLSIVAIALLAVGVWSVWHRRKATPEQRRGAKGMAIVGLVAITVTLLAAAPRVAITATTYLQPLRPESRIADAESTPDVTEMDTDEVFRIAPGLALLDPAVIDEHGALGIGILWVLSWWMLITGVRERDRVVFVVSTVALTTFWLCAVPPVTGWLVDNGFYALKRLSKISVILLYVAMAWAMQRVRWSQRRSERLAAVAAISVVAVLTLPYLQTVLTPHPSTYYRLGAANESILRSRASALTESIGEVPLGAMREYFDGQQPLVAATEDLSYGLAGVVGCRIIAAPDGHSPLAVEIGEGPYRRADMAEMFDPTTTPARRRELVEEWAPEYAAVWVQDEEDKEVVDRLRDDATTFKQVIGYTYFVVFEVVDR